MSELINFNFFSSKASDCDSSILSNIRRITFLNGQRFVVSIDESIILDRKLLENLLSEIIILNNLGIQIILIPSFVTELKSHYISLRESINSNFCSDIEILEFAFSKLTATISKTINNLGGKSITLCGKDAKIIYGERSDVNISSINDFKFLEKSNVYASASVNNDANLIFSEESTNSILILLPFILGKGANTFFCDPSMLALFLTSNCDVSRLIFIDEKIPVKTANLNSNIIARHKLQEVSQQSALVNAILTNEALFESELDYIHLINKKNFSLISEINLSGNSIVIHNHK
jgi:acetylglutamate kinase